MVFPSHCGRERPASSTLPPRFMSYAVCGCLNDIDATEGTITLHTANIPPLLEQAQFAQFIHDHLAEAAESVQRLRHWLCPHCHAAKGNEAVLMDKLERPKLSARNKGQVLVLEGMARFKSANQNHGSGRSLYLQRKEGPSHLRRLAAGREVFRIKKSHWIKIWTDQPYPVMLVIGQEAEGQGWPRFDGLDLSDRGLYDPELKRIRSDWHDPIGRANAETRTFPNVRWMEISSVLQRELAAARTPEQIKQIEFVGCPTTIR